MSNIIWGNPENEAFFKEVARRRGSDVSSINFIVAIHAHGGPNLRIYPKDCLPKNFFLEYSNFYIYEFGGTVAQYAPELVA